MEVAASSVVPHPDASGLDVDPQAGRRLRRRRRGWRRLARARGAAAKHGPDAGEQFGQAEGLGEVVVGPDIETDHAVELSVPGGQDDDSPGIAVLARPATHLEPVDVGQSEVEQEKVDRAACETLECGESVGEPLDRVALALQGPHEGSSDLVIVLDQQHVCPHGGRAY